MLIHQRTRTKISAQCSKCTGREEKELEYYKKTLFWKLTF